jgi:hypothetical protein
MSERQDKSSGRRLAALFILWVALGACVVLWLLAPASPVAGKCGSAHGYGLSGVFVWLTSKGL